MFLIQIETLKNVTVTGNWDVLLDIARPMVHQLFDVLSFFFPE